MQNVARIIDMDSNKSQYGFECRFYERWLSDGVGRTELASSSFEHNLRALRFSLDRSIGEQLVGSTRGRPLLIPFFFASYGIEYLVLHFMVAEPEGGAPNLAYQRVRTAVRNANPVTCGAMFYCHSNLVGHLALSSQAVLRR